MRSIVLVDSLKPGGAGVVRLCTSLTGAAALLAEPYSVIIRRVLNGDSGIRATLAQV